jgi:hypothetical protein
MRIVNFSLPLELWCLGFVVLANFMSAWFFSNFPQHLWNLLHDDNQVYTKDDLVTAAVDRHGAFGDLWVCPICLGTWFSFLISFLLGISVGLPAREVLQFTAIATTTWPVSFYLLYGILKRV